MRRTSLPAISVQRPVSAIQQALGIGANTADSALLSEAHGIVTEMLNEPHLPPTVISGLQALYLLLSPSGGRHSPSPRSPRPTPHVSLSHEASDSGSDSEENPYTGEKPSVQRKNVRRGVAAHLLRRMSTSTWTTTTSATGMPTLEPQPSRRRATSFRGISDFSPSGSPTHNPRQETTRDDYRCHTSTALRNGTTTSIPRTGYRDRPPGSGYPHSPVRATESFHSMDQYDIHRNKLIGINDRVPRMHSVTSQQIKEIPRQTSDKSEICDNNKSDTNKCEYSDRKSERMFCNNKNVKRIHRRNSSEEFSTSESYDSKLKDCSQNRSSGVLINYNSQTNDERGSNQIKRKFGPRHATSDYESSGSPSSTEASEEGMRQRLRRPQDLGDDDLRPKEFAKTTLKQNSQEPISDELSGSKDSEEETSENEESEENSERRKFKLKDGVTYDLDQLQDHPLLGRISDWDYPIFDLADSTGDRLLSSLCYRVFSEVGLFETFRIPMKQFFNYFHNLEMGYRSIPYHNQIHAADVLQAVYYFTSQPIPGFAPPPDSAFSVPEGSTLSQIPCRTFSTNETYGILGAHLPALELMALYTAAAMHDYDHPGRTNAFLVTTHATQAVLYNDRSVLENHHAAAAWSLFLSNPNYNFLVHLDRAEFKRFRYLVIESILATDLKRHFEILAEFNAKANEVDAPGIDWNSETDRLLAVQMSIKLADINGPCKEPELHRNWTYRIAEEFYEQGDEESKLGLPISPYMDRRNPQLSKLQESFINHLVAPLCNAYGEAGLMPGVWLDEELRANQDGEEDTDLTEEEEDTTLSSDSDDVVPSAKPKCRVRKIYCLLTQHIQENHHYWVNKIKEEQLSEGGSKRSTPDEISPSGHELKELSCKEDRPLSLTLSGADQPMESIEEEKTPASISSSHSFIFEKEDSKL